MYHLGNSVSNSSSTLLTLLGDSLVSEIQYWALKCWSACLKNVRELCSWMWEFSWEWAERIQNKEYQQKIRNIQEKSPSQKECDLASLNSPTHFIRRIFWNKIVQYVFGKQEFWLTLWWLERWWKSILLSVWCDANIFIWSTVDFLRIQCSKWLPTIVLILAWASQNPWSENTYIDWSERNGIHYVVVYSIDDTSVYYRDPFFKYSSSMSIDEFEARRKCEDQYLNDWRVKLLKRFGLIQENSWIRIDQSSNLYSGFF